MNKTPKDISDCAVRELFIEIEKRGLKHYREIYSPNPIGTDSISVFLLGIVDVLSEIREAQNK